MFNLENNTFNWNTFSCIISVVIGVIAFISPIVTAIINNYHQTKIKKLDMYEIEKRNALSNFIKACENFILEGEYVNNKLWSAYYSSIHQLYIYFVIPDDSMFLQLENVIKRQNIFESNHKLTKVVVTLSKQISKE